MRLGGDHRLSEIQHAYPLILNKVASPHYATPVLRRARLIAWMNEASDSRAVVLAADAGYGKTTLVWQWEREVRSRATGTSSTGTTGTGRSTSAT